MKARILTEKVLVAEEALTELVVYFPENGSVIRQYKAANGRVLKSELLVRLVYADTEMIEVLIEALTRHVMGCSHQGDAPGS